MPHSGQKKGKKILIHTNRSFYRIISKTINSIYQKRKKKRGIRGANYLPGWAGGDMDMGSSGLSLGGPFCSCSSRASVPVMGSFCLSSERGESQASWFPSTLAWPRTLLLGRQRIKTESRQGVAGRAGAVEFPFLRVPGLLLSESLATHAAHPAGTWGGEGVTPGLHPSQLLHFPPSLNCSGQE